MAENNGHWLAPSKLFQKKGDGGALTWGPVHFNQRNMVKSLDLPMPNLTQNHKCICCI